MIDRLWRRAAAPVDVASLAAFRVLFGLTMAVAMARLLASGWLDEVLVAPSFFFKYPGFAWVGVPGPAGLYTLAAVVLVAAVCVALGLWYRVAAGVFVLGFAWLQLMDATNYLNHYYLVILLGGLAWALPLGRFWSLDARRGGALAAAPAWWIWLLRAQLAAVYVHAGLAKATSDWLVHGQPLGIWLAARGDAPVIGPLLQQAWAPLALSWAGFLFDATIVAWLLWPRTRRLAWGVVVAFHGMTWLLFDIGMFPLIMVTSTLLFFPPDWPRRLLRRPPAAPPAVATRRPLAAVALAFCLFPAFFPLRSHVLGDAVLWDEVGMRWSWRVMVREKMGSLTYRVRLASGREIEVNPRRYLTWRQWAEMSGQPDLIVQLAHHVARDFYALDPDPEVRVDAWISLNGRPPARLIDPAADLVHLADGQRVTLPAPAGPPLRQAAWSAR